MRVTDNMAKIARRIQLVIMGIVLIIACSEPHIITFIILLVLTVPFLICRAIEEVWEDQNY